MPGTAERRMSATGGEKVSQHGLAITFKNTAVHLGCVSDVRVARNIPYRTTCAKLGIPRTKHNRPDMCLDAGTCTHRAGLERDHQRAVGKIPRVGASASAVRLAAQALCPAARALGHSPISRSLISRNPIIRNRSACHTIRLPMCGIRLSGIDSAGIHIRIIHISSFRSVARIRTGLGQRLRGLTHRQNLGMSQRVAMRFTRVAAAADNPPVGIQHHRADWYIAGLGRLPGQHQRFVHRLRICHFQIHTASLHSEHSHAHAQTQSQTVPGPALYIRSRPVCAHPCIHPPAEQNLAQTTILHHSHPISDANPRTNHRNTPPIHPQRGETSGQPTACSAVSFSTGRNL